MRTKSIALITILLAFLAACAGASSSATAEESAEPGAGSPEPEPRATATATSEPAVPAVVDDEKALDDYLGLAGRLVRDGGRTSGGHGGVEQFAEQQRQIEQEVQLCMQALGFEYAANTGGSGIVVLGSASDASVPPDEFASTRGFGISTGFDSLLEGDIDFGPGPNSNDEYIKSLGASEIEAYFLALQGEPPSIN